MMDLFDAAAARDAALARVALNAGNWMLHARRSIEDLPAGWTGTGEDIRLELRRQGLPPPHHHNTWGSLIRVCTPRFIVKTGASAPMKTKRSHARKTPVYRRKGGEA